jgi:hypothetical protein
MIAPVLGRVRADRRSPRDRGHHDGRPAQVTTMKTASRI